MQTKEGEWVELGRRWAVSCASVAWAVLELRETLVGRLSSASRLSRLKTAQDAVMLRLGIPYTEHLESLLVNYSWTFTRL